jgi:hypothetical protein
MLMVLSSVITRPPERTIVNPTKVVSRSRDFHNKMGQLYGLVINKWH